jgi:hypothetical protein
VRTGLIASLATAVIALASPALAASPCEGVDLGLSADEAARLAPVVGTVRRSFLYDDWRILGVEGGGGETFLFYRGDPAHSRTVARWNGGGLDEESQIREWTYETAPTFPWHLAKCFAWRVTAHGALLAGR